MQAGDRLGGRLVTEQRTRGPAFDVVALAVDGRTTHLALDFPAAARADRWFTAELPAHARSRSSPGVIGIAPLVQAEPEQGALVYETGDAVPLAHVLARLANDGRTLGVRGSLELAYQVSDILVEADGAFGRHGQVHPWTIAITATGRPVLLAHGVPPIETEPHVDALRYAPPERFTADPIDLRSDLFGLWLVVAQGVLGRPLYDGELDDVRQQAKRGDALSRWYPHRERVSTELHELMSAGLKPDWDARRSDPVDVVHALYGLTQRFDAEGDTLAEVVASVWPSSAEAGMPPDATTEAIPRRTAEDLDARRAAIREQLAARTTNTEAIRAGTMSSTTTAIHGHTDYVQLDPLTDVRPIEPVGPATTAVTPRAAPHAPPADLSWRVVNHGGRAVRVAVFDGDQAATVALRAAIEHGALPVDTSGRLLCGYALAQSGERLPGHARLAGVPPGPLDLVEVPVALRLVTVQVEAEPPIRFRSPTSLAVPAAWFVAGIAQWLGLPDAPWAAFVDGQPVDRDVLLADVLTGSDLVVIAPLRARPR